MSLVVLMISLLLKCHLIIAIWPPAYKINLTQQETFVIFENIDEDIYSDEDELIKPESTPNKVHVDKFFRLHRLATRKNKENEMKYIEEQKEFEKFKESFGDEEELVPWIAGFVDRNGTIRDNMNVYYSNTLAKMALEENLEVEKRQDEDILDVRNMTGKNEEVNYDYNAFQSEYNAEVKEALTSNNTLNYTEAKEDESFKDVVDEMVDFKKTPRNCTEEEKKGIGFAAIECFWIDVKTINKKEKHEQLVILKKISKLVLIWFCVYLAIAIPCWCQRGWCCCCFRCKFCRPTEQIDAAKKFLMDNPPGIYKTEEDGEILFEPTVYEKLAHKKLEHILMKL